MSDREARTGGIAVTEHSVNGVPVLPPSTVGRDVPPDPAMLEGGRHRRPWARTSEPEAPQDRMARLRLLAGSAVGVGCLMVAHRLVPEQGSLFAAPSDAFGWTALICGVAGLWLVPGLWLSAVMMRFGAGPVAWLGTRIATTLTWYVLVGPLIHQLGQGARVTTGGILIATTAATAAACLGLALGLARWPSAPWLRALVAAVIGGVSAQAVIWAWMRVWTSGMDYLHIRRLDWMIVLGCALLVAVGSLSHPKLPPVLTARNMRKPLVALAVIATTAAALLATGARWSPAQQMPSAFGAEQVPAPDGADVALTLTAIGPDGSGLIQRAEFTTFDDTGRPIPVDMRLVQADGTADRATLLVVLQPAGQTVLCAGIGRLAGASETGTPVKLTVRDHVSGVLVQAVIPDGWCPG
jgi:hypothetical protein